MAKKWDDVKCLIIWYYIEQKMALKDVMHIMEQRHHFHASQRSYRQKLHDWNIRKYRNHDNSLSPVSGGSSLDEPHTSQQGNQGRPPQAQSYQSDDDYDQRGRVATIGNPVTPIDTSGCMFHPRYARSSRNMHRSTGGPSAQQQYDLNMWDSGPSGPYYPTSMSPSMSHPAVASPANTYPSPGQMQVSHYRLYSSSTNGYNNDSHHGSSSHEAQQHSPQYTWNTDSDQRYPGDALEDDAVRHRRPSGGAYDYYGRGN